MAATVSRHHSGYAATHKTLPITMPSKGTSYTYPVSRVAVAGSPIEFSDSSTTSSGSRHSSGRSSARSSDYAASQYDDDFDNYKLQSGVDVVDMLSERLNTAFDPMRMDKSLARQAQT